MAGDEGTDDALVLESFLTFRFSILAKLLDRRLARTLGDGFGLAVAEYRVLAQVTMRPRSTVRAIADRTFVDKAQVSRVVAALEKQDLVRRCARSTDRRSPEFTATEAGRALMEQIVPRRREQERELVEFLGDGQEAEQLSDVVGSLITRLTEPSPDAEPEPTALQRRQAIRDDRVRRSRERA